MVTFNSCEPARTNRSCSEFQLSYGCWWLVNDVCSGSRRKPISQLGDHLPVDKIDTLTVHVRESCHEQTVTTGETSAREKRQEQQQQFKRPTENMRNQARRGQRPTHGMSDEHQRSSDRSRRTVNKSSHGGDVPVRPVREKPTVGSGISGKAEVRERPGRRDSQRAAVDHSTGAVIARTIYTSDRRTRPGDDTTALTLVTG